uniref:Herpesvirus glycoprotein L n=1 Tax=Siphoviridae sp. ctn8e14 TaxID=2827936 RepID=A0A8S5T4A0_9CAUD|nr:MAG TPA: Herpesvirus glycoprotein L [Siphoviridae sp. ctn8e14]
MSLTDFTLGAWDAAPSVAYFVNPFSTKYELIIKINVG